MGGLLFVGVILALVPARHFSGGERASSRSESISVLVVWASLPIVLALLISLVSTPIFVSRYLIGSLPALLLTGSYGLTRFVRGRVGFGLVSTFFVAILITSYIRYATAPREDWRGVCDV